MICPRCKSEVNDDMNFCPQCGMKIDRCPHCHQPIVSGAKFCSHCGSSVLKNYQESHIEGYYRPLSDIPYTESYHEPEEKVDFQEIKVNKKVNKNILVIAVSIMVVLTAVSYMYIYHGPSLSNHISGGQQSTDQPKDLPLEKMEIGGMTSFATHTGNINQEGHVYQDEDIIYVVNDQGHLVSMDNKLENRKTIINDDCDYINVVGNTIYFTNDDSQLCSISTDGKDKKVVLNKEIYYLIIKDDKAYYQAQDDDLERIYVYDLKTNKETRLNNRNAYNLNVLEDKIYYTSTDGIYVVGLDGKGEEKVLDGKYYNLIYQNQKLYFLSKQATGSISRANINVYDIATRKTEVLIENTGGLMNITDEYIFYTNSSQVMKYNLKTKENTKIYSSGLCESIQIIGDKLILEVQKNSFEKDEYLMIMDFDGQNTQKLFSSQNGDFI